MPFAWSYVRELHKEMNYMVSKSNDGQHGVDEFLPLKKQKAELVGWIINIQLCSSCMCVWLLLVEGRWASSLSTLWWALLPPSGGQSNLGETICGHNCFFVASLHVNGISGCGYVKIYLTRSRKKMKFWWVISFFLSLWCCCFLPLPFLSLCFWCVWKRAGEKDGNEGWQVGSRHEFIKRFSWTIHSVPLLESLGFLILIGLAHLDRKLKSEFRVWRNVFAIG